jgi:hypothetical protein
VVLACEPAQLSGRGTLWSLWVASASDRCAELSPPAQFYCAISVRDVWGFSVGYLCVFARPCVSRCYAPRVRVAGVRAVTQL